MDTRNAILVSILREALEPADDLVYDVLDCLRDARLGCHCNSLGLLRRRHGCDPLDGIVSGIVEQAGADELFTKKLHPYTQAFVSAVPVPDMETRTIRIVLPGEVPSPINPPWACRFHPRCPYATDLCRRVEPKLEEYLKGHFAACHYAKDFI